MGDIYKETEGRVTWQIENLDEVFVITSTNGTETLTETYTCFYPIMFGYDVDDINKVNDILDAQIEKLK